MEKLAIGILRTSHGVQGYMKVRSLSGEVDHFYGLKRVWIKQGTKEIPAVVEDIKSSSKDLLVKLDIISGPEEGKRYSNCDLLADRTDCAQLEEGEVYVTDLIGCTLVNSGRELGKVIAFNDSSSATLLEVKVPSGEHFFVPYLDVYIGEVNLEKKEIELTAEWLLE